jgi:2-keto-4-pentenoate hydratase/2-oxohepta-3-ene-1,7-dioic acid hydratase in catechol pathway
LRTYLKGGYGTARHPANGQHFEVRPTKIARFKLNDRIAYGDLDGGQLRPLEGEFPDLKPVAGAAPVALSAVKLLTPTLPLKIIAIGPGQRAAVPPSHEPPERPTLWFKPPPSSLTNPGDPVIYPPLATRLTHEVEVAIVIGRKARRVKREEAESYIAGYTVHNDLTGGDPMKEGRLPISYHWKSFEGCSTFGPAVVTGMKMSDLKGLAMRCRVNGELRTDGRCDLIYPPDDLVSWLSHIFTLYPGDIISTGTTGVGPLVPGDVMESEVEGLGAFTTPIVASNYERD